MSKSSDKNFNFCQIVRKYFVCSRTLLNLLVELVFYHFVNHILTNSTDFLTINSYYRPVCDGLKGRRTLGAKRANDIFPKSVEELVGSNFRGGKHGKCAYVPQIVRNVPIWYIFGRTHI